MKPAIQTQTKQLLFEYVMEQVKQIKQSRQLQQLVHLSHSHKVIKKTLSRILASASFPIIILDYLN